MKAAIYTSPGEPEVLQYQDVPDPVAGPGELLIRVEAISIEGGDLGRRRTATIQDKNGVLGYAAAGEIIALGEGVTTFQVGQKVTTFGFAGSHASLRAVSAASSWVVPAGLDMPTAAAAPISLGTAAYALNLAEFKKEDTVLVTGATGGVGISTVQIATAAGATVFGTGSSPESLEQLKPFGLTEPIILNGKEDDLEKVLKGKRFDVVIDNVGIPSLTALLPYLNDGARVVLVGARKFDQPIELTIYDILSKRLKIIGCYLGPVMGQPAVRALISQTLEQVAAGELKVPFDKTYPLSEAAAAHRRAEERGRLGRVIIVPDQD